MRDSGGVGHHFILKSLKFGAWKWLCAIPFATLASYHRIERLERLRTQSLAGEIGPTDAEGATAPETLRQKNRKGKYTLERGAQASADGITLSGTITEGAPYRSTIGSDRRCLACPRSLSSQIVLFSLHSRRWHHAPGHSLLLHGCHHERRRCERSTQTYAPIPAAPRSWRSDGSLCGIRDARSVPEWNPERTPSRPRGSWTFRRVPYGAVRNSIAKRR